MTDFTDTDKKKLNNSYQLYDEVLKYLFFWRYFLISVIIFLFIGFSYSRYSHKTFTTTAKIKIIDQSESAIELPSYENFFSGSNINLENEIEILKSYPLLEKVVKNLNLNIKVKRIGNVKNTITVDYPFDITLKLPPDSLKEEKYRLNIINDGFELVNLKDNSVLLFKGNSTKGLKHNLSFDIYNFDAKAYIQNDVEGYYISFITNEEIITQLKRDIQISQIGDDSEIIKLSHEFLNHQYSKLVLDNLIKVFNEDGIKDRQLVHKRTIDFINSRYAFLSLELDSIEIAKQIYKIDNNLVDFKANSTLSLEKSSKSLEEIFTIENQISLTSLIINSLNNSKLELLPSNLGIENSEINILINNFNEKILERKKLIISAGASNPSVIQIDNILKESKENIKNSLENNLKQLGSLSNKFSNQNNFIDNQIAVLPEKEKVLRAIERNQSIKENLYLFLLQKREESEVAFAITEPTVKIVESAISDKVNFWPKNNLIYLISLALGVLIPFGIIYLIFLFKNKIYSREDLEGLGIKTSVISEIPQIEEVNTTIQSSNERSVLAESFRVLVSNLNFLLEKNRDEGSVIITTSTIKGEGKTFCAINLALTYSTLNKKTLLVGADLHNPQIHKYFDKNKSTSGLSNFLVDPSINWEKELINKLEGVNCDIMVAGQIPPNPAELLNNGNIDVLISQAKKKYDFIIIDTPPALLVSDTLSISYLADIALFVVRCNHTTHHVIDFINDVIQKKKFKRITTLLNGVGAKNRYGYGYSYKYGYNYSYKYGYNYGYGYGYEADKEE